MRKNIGLAGSGLETMVLYLDHRWVLPDGCEDSFRARMDTYLASMCLVWDISSGHTGSTYLRRNCRPCERISTFCRTRTPVCASAFSFHGSQ